MSQDELVLKRLEGMEAQLKQLVDASQGWQELKHDLTPIVHDAFKTLMKEFGDVEQGFQLEDAFALLKRFMRSIKNITYVLEQMENIIDLWHTIEPLLHSAVPKGIEFLDEMEQKGVFRMYKAMVEVRGKMARAYTPEDIEVMGDGFVSMLGLIKKLSTPQAREMLEKLADMMGDVDLNSCKECGPLGLVAGMSSKEARKGLGVMLEFTKSLGKLKD
ncbi:MAG: DUF1641 domain-containing protein [Humidesulfovibrio sp.]|uniref:DUF1641 domain-containing protein n=1 Tax=Humidesulfovibrio sp. TaxID=2910988 RepID=UPI00273545AC|nr:DUF1641 domain-containing protein [Humidesulfovibrio sp.]MDP2846618.1 DUF1641 domain-containing protein [Humidesulfovibrio sp.]